MDKPTFLVYFKIIFLAAIIIFGILILGNFAKNKKEAAKNTPGLEKLFSLKNLQNSFNREIRTNEGYKSTLKEIDNTTKSVLGEADQIKNQAIEQSKEFATDYIYQQTVVSMIESMYHRLPERQKEKVLENICK